MAKKKDKARRQKFISRITEDRTVSKKEGLKAAKKGITLNQIQRGYIDAFRGRQKEFADRPHQIRQRQPFAQAPSYQPLKIKGGAERALTKKMKPSGTKDKGKKDQKVVTPKPTPTPTEPKTSYQSKINKLIKKQIKPLKKTLKQIGKKDPTTDAIKSLQQTITDLYAAQPDYTADISTMMADQREYFEGLREDEDAADLLRELTFRTTQENMARSGLMPEFRIGTRSPQTQMGTSGFKRRPITSTISQGINI